MVSVVGSNDADADVAGPVDPTNWGGARLRAKTGSHFDIHSHHSS